MTETIPSHDSRASPAFDPPKYKISYGPDQVLQWDPPSNSRALAVALSWHFPVEKTLESKMQAAIKVFLKEEQKSSLGTDSGSSPEATSNSVPRESDTLQPTLKVSDGLNKRPLAWSESAFQVLNWDPDVKGFKPKRQRRKYEKDESVKVKANRGNACEEHRRRKVKCDPDSCPYNKQRGNAESVVSEDSEKPGDNLPNFSVGLDTTPPVEEEKPNENEINAQSIFGPSAVLKIGDSIHTLQDDEFSWQQEPKIEPNIHSWTGSHPLTPPPTDFNVSPTQYLQNMQDPNLAPLAFNIQQDDFLQGFGQSVGQGFDDWRLSDYIQINENDFQLLQSEGQNDQDFYKLQPRGMDSNLLQSDQLITPADFPELTDAHSRDSFLLESANFKFQPHLQQPLSSLGDIAGLQGQQGPNRLELPGPEFSSPNYTSLGQFVNGEPHPFDAPLGKSSGFPAPLAYVSNNEATAQPKGYTNTENIITPHRAPFDVAFDAEIGKIRVSWRNHDTLSIQTQSGIAESQDNLEGVSSDEMLRMYSTMWKPPTPTKMNWANGERSLDLESYSPVPRRNINPKTTVPVADTGKDWLNDSNSRNRKALDLPEIQGAAAEYYAVLPSNINFQTTPPPTRASTSTFPIDTSRVPPVYNLSNQRTATTFPVDTSPVRPVYSLSSLSAITSARKGNRGKIRKVARALTAFGNRLATRAPDQFGDSSSRSLELEVDYPEIGGEELRVGALPQIAEQHKQYQDADRTVTPVPCRHRESRTATFAGSGVSGIDVLASSIGDGPQQRHPMVEATPPVHHKLSSTASMFSNTQFFNFDLGQDADLQAPPRSLPPCSVDEIRGVDLTVEKETVLAKMDESIAGEAGSAFEMNVSGTNGKEPSFKPLHRNGSSTRKRTKMEDFLSDSRIGAWGNQQLDLQQFQTAKGPVRDGPNPPRRSSFKPLLRKDSSSKSSISSVHHIGVLRGGKHAADENMAGLDELSRTHNLQSELSNEKALSSDASRLTSHTPAQSTDAESSKLLTYEQAHEIYKEYNIGGAVTLNKVVLDSLPPPTARRVHTPPSPTQSAKATYPPLPPGNPASNHPPPQQLRRSISLMSIDLDLPRIVGPVPPPSPPPPMSISNQAVPSDDLEIHELFTPEQDSWRKEVAAVASSKAEITRVAKEIDLSTPSPGWVEPSSDYDPTIEATLTPEERKWMKGTPARREMEQEMRGPGRLEVAESLLEDDIRSVEEGSLVVPPPQPRSHTAYGMNDSFDSIRYYPVLPCNIKGKRKGFPAMEERRHCEPFNTRNKMGERKANRKKAREAQKTQYCGPGGPCIWVLCLPCVAVEVVKLGGEVVGMYGREGVEMVRGWIRGLKKGKKEGG